MEAIKVDAFLKPGLDDKGESIQVGVICIQVAKTITITDYVKSKEMLKTLFNVTIIEETVRELYSAAHKIKDVQLIVLHIRGNKDT